MRELRSVLKLTRRSIRSFLGRYLALLLIVLLSVGFFSGLKVTKPAMYDTCGDYLRKQKLYDFRLYSRTGFLSTDIQGLSRLDGIETAEGALGTDAIVRLQETEEKADESGEFAVHIQSLQSDIDLPDLTAGVMPKYPSQCLADCRLFGPEDIGKQLKIDTDASDRASGFLHLTSFTIVGLCNSPLYLSAQRGSTTIGSGQLDGFLYVPEDAFIDAIFTEVDLTLSDQADVYSDEYEAQIDQVRPRIEDYLEKRAITGYVLTREENPGYVSFRNDTAIVSGIADIFPLFFVMIGMLVCITTMTRMVEEERQTIGTLKALGFSSASIYAKYLLYAGSGAIFGWAAGFLLGTWAIPQVFWLAYSSVYGFAPLPYRFSPSLAVLTLAAALAGIGLSTYLAVRSELSQQPARLIRPKGAKAGRRILLERIKPLWKRLSFLRKISLRNMFRYKQRLFMMLIGIGCCAALVLTGFGVRDSMTGITHLQYDIIQNYQMEVTIENRKIDKVTSSVLNQLDPSMPDDRMSSENSPAFILPCSQSQVTLKADGNGSGSGLWTSMDMVSLYCFDEHDAEKAGRFWTPVGGSSFPGKGEAAICTKIAQKLGLAAGDDLRIQDADLKELRVRVSGVFENYMGSVLIIGSDTWEMDFGTYKPTTLLVRTKGVFSTAEGPQSGSAAKPSETPEDLLARKIQDTDGVTGVTLLSSARKTADHALSCVYYIILLLILFAGALEFIVIYNLTSINLAERSREIATVEVLGFYPRETDSYVLRENLSLSVLASLLGLPLGWLFHKAVMSRIVVDGMAFDIHIEPLSYLLAVVITILFAAVVNLVMRRYIRRIPMAESLKAVE